MTATTDTYTVEWSTVAAAVPLRSAHVDDVDVGEMGKLLNEAFTCF